MKHRIYFMLKVIVAGTAMIIFYHLAGIGKQRGAWLIEAILYAVIFAVIILTGLLIVDDKNKYRRNID